MAPSHPTGFLPHSAPMSSVRRATFVLTILVSVALAGCGSGPPIDEAFPPGNPVLGEDVGDDPVVGSGGDRPLDSGDHETRDYTLLAILAVCLIAAGVLLVRVERWERRRASGSGEGS